MMFYEKFGLFARIILFDLIFLWFPKILDAQLSLPPIVFPVQSLPQPTNYNKEKKNLKLKPKVVFGCVELYFKNLS